MRMYRKISISGVVVSVAAVFLLTAPKNAEACSGASCEGLDPKAAGCTADATTLGRVNLYTCDEVSICDWQDIGSTYLGTVEYSYSPSCNATWARLFGLSLPPAGGRGSDSLNILVPRTPRGYEVSGSISAPSYGVLNSVMVGALGAEVCLEIDYIKLGISGFVHNHSGCVNTPSQTDPVHPNFYVVSLAYAAPGQQSTVTYGTGSTAGSQVSTTSTFRNDLSVTAGILPLTRTFGLSTSYSTSDSVQVTKNTGVTYSVYSKQDPIDHRNDTFFVWVNPQAGVTFTPGLSNLQWALEADSSGFANVIPLTVNEAIDPTTIRAGFKPYFAKLTRQDFDMILSLDPYVDVATHTVRTTIPLSGSARFSPTGYSLPLDGMVGSDFKTVDSKTVTTTTTGQVSVTTGVNFDSSNIPLKLVFKFSDSFTFTYQTSDSTSWTTSQSADVSLKTPSTTFAGDYNVYFDHVFGTFLLVDAPPPAFIRASGVVRDSAGNPKADERVTLWLSDGSRRVTYTDGKGQYRFYGLSDGASTIEVRGERILSHIDGARPITVDFGPVPQR